MKQTDFHLAPFFPYNIEEFRLIPVIGVTLLWVCHCVLQFKMGRYSAFLKKKLNDNVYVAGI